MSGFESARVVEARGLSVLTPFLDERADGRFVLFDKGPLARALQETTGDGVFNVEDGGTFFVEIKCERKWTGNLFLETWSNRNLEDRQSHARRGCNPGWLYKLNADLL